jgi:predicted transcriptional regulator
MGAEARRSGKLTEDEYRTFFQRVADWLQETLDNLRAAFESTPSPILQRAIDDTVAILEAARTGDPAKLPAQMELRLSDNQGTQSAPPIEWESFKQSIRDFAAQKLPTYQMLNLGRASIEGLPDLANI